MHRLKLKYSVILEISRSINKLSHPFLQIRALLGRLKNVSFYMRIKKFA